MGSEHAPTLSISALPFVFIRLVFAPSCLSACMCHDEFMLVTYAHGIQDGSMTVYGWHSSTFKRAKAIPDGFKEIVHILSNSAVKANYQRPNRYQVLYCHYTPAYACGTETERSICKCDCLTYECTYVGACGCRCMSVRKTGRRSAIGCSCRYKWMCAGLCPWCVLVHLGVRFAVLCVSVLTASGVC